MKKLHETVKRVYRKVFDLFGLQVLSEDGNWEDINSLNITDAQEVYRV